LDQAPLTGESLPVPKGPGDPVLAGTINGDGALEARSTHPAGETTLARVVRLVASAQVQRAPSERWVEKFARVYTPVVMVLAVLVFLVPPVFLGGSWIEWFYRSLVLLVIACPCALVISTPVSIVAGLAAAARNGVLVKGGVHLEEPSGLKAIALDKTGTLTEGRLAVVDLVPLNGHDEEDLLRRAAAIEARSEHPIARAIVSFSRSRGISVAPAEDVRVIQGKGATARLDRREFWLGSHRYLEERRQETPEVHATAEALSAQGKTIVALGNQKHVCGLIALADGVRPGARAAMDALRAEGIGHIVMLTGDHRATAEVIARQTGVDEIHADLLPSDKVAVLESLVARFGKVAMVGDGVNDAPALARATLGIAMGEGTDVAIETADVALMSDDLSKLPWLIRHSRRTVAVIRENVVAALSVKVLFAVLTIFGYASLWSAIAADTGTSLLVIFNGLRLLRSKPARR
jgi:Cd2+/Zn2+-exporting ATPase